MAYEVIFGEHYSKSPAVLIELINDWSDIKDLAKKTRIRLGGGEEAVNERQAKMADLEQMARDARSTNQFQNALKYLQEAAEIRGGYTDSFLREMVEISLAYGQLEQAVAYCALAKLYYVIEPSTWYDEMEAKLYARMKKSYLLEGALGEIQSSLSGSNLFPLFYFLYCVENKRGGAISYQQKAAFLGEVAKNEGVMTVFREADFAKMSLDELHLVVSFFTVVRRLGEDTNSMSVGWFADAIFSLHEKAVSSDALQRLARGEPGAYDRFYGEILAAMSADVAKNNPPRFFYDLAWHANVCVMFLVCGTKPKERNLEKMEQFGAMEWSMVQSEKLAELMLQDGDSFEAELEQNASQRLVACRQMFDLLALALAASFAEWKCVLVNPVATMDEQNRNRTTPCFKRLIPCFDMLTHAHIMGPPLSTLMRQHLPSLHLQMAKQALFFAINISHLTELSRKCLFPGSVRYIFQTMSFARSAVELAPIFDFDPFRQRFIEACRLIFTTSPKSLIKSEIFNQFMLITGRLGSASPRFLEQTFPFAVAFFQRYKHEDGLHCIVQVLRTASKGQLQKWAVENGELFAKIASHFYVLLMSQINNLLQAERLIDFLLAIKTLVGNKMVAPSDIFGHLNAERLVFVEKITALITGRGYDSDDTLLFFRPFMVTLRPIAVMAAAVTLVTLCHEDEKIRQICLKNKNKERAVKKLRQQFDHFSSLSSAN